MKKRTILTTAIVLCLILATIFVLSACSKRHEPNENFVAIQNLIELNQVDSTGIKLKNTNIPSLGKFDTTISNMKNSIYLSSFKTTYNGYIFISLFVDGGLETESLRFNYTDANESNSKLVCRLLANRLNDIPTVDEVTLVNTTTEKETVISSSNSLYNGIVADAKRAFLNYLAWINLLVKYYSDYAFGLNDILYQPKK